jgi:hypothetical protein
VKGKITEPKFEMYNNLIKQALDLEEPNPEEALKIYKKLESENKEFHGNIVFIGIICPIIAYSLVFHLLQSPNPPRDLYTFLILAIVGFAPPSTMLTIKAKTKIGRIGGTEFIERLHTAFIGMLAGTLIVFSNLIGVGLLILLAIILATLLTIPISLATLILPNTSFLWPNELPEIVLWTSFISSFFVIFLIELAEPPFFNTLVFLSPPPPLTRRQMIKEFIGMIPVGLRLNFVNKLKFIAGIFVSILLVGSGPLGLLYGGFYQGVAAFGFTGLLLGFSLSKAIEKDYYLGDLYQLGIVRCLLRLDGRAEANYRIGRLTKERKPWRTPPVDNLTTGLSLFMDNYSDYPYYVREAVASSLTDDAYEGLYLFNVRNSMKLTGIDIDSRVSNVIEGKYAGVGIVEDAITIWRPGDDIKIKQTVTIRILSGWVFSVRGKGNMVRLDFEYREKNDPEQLEEGNLIGYYEEGDRSKHEKIEHRPPVKEKSKIGSFMGFRPISLTDS